MSTEVPEVHAASPAVVIDLHVFQGTGPAPVAEPLRLDPREDRVELGLADVERVMVRFKAFGVVEIQRQGVVDPDGGEVPYRSV